ncbi:hexosaminidase [Tessaracoccus bendigoensis DSM 12906]|uniref:beta-N-acetylhexosaminidase n=1 Tax=Tessaracoccus bendigoensis DSM 12906 TaxID=1123357 RepID=A0A1M6MJ77_9ACTN|nr:family 20 glycosylhydrolase [Tessaracoccus bendigoensis]SHJ83518.1 hexosaminidase [Tessaracoccus bendigoensis DSM 12906]
MKLGTPSVVDHVTIKWEAACAATYKLQVSDDGTTWTDATGVISPTCGTTDTQKLNAATASQTHGYVRMQALSRTPISGSYWGVSLYEFEVWDGEQQAEVPSEVDLVPLPSQLIEDGGDPYVLDGSTKIVATGAAVPVAELLASELRAATGFELPVVASATGNVIALNLDANYQALEGPSPEDAYDLVTEPGKVTITAKEAHGLFNATQTLRQLFPPLIYSDTAVQRDWTAAAVTIKDSPRFAHRGTQVDSARSFVEVDDLKDIIDTLSSVKISRLHLHLADDQGWRIEITNEGKEAGDPVDYTQLAKVSGVTAMQAVNSTAKPYTNTLGRTGYYTQEQYRDIVAYAAERFVTVIPEIDAPSHSNAILHAIPELNSANSKPAATVYGTAKEQNNGNVGESTLDTHNPQTWVSMKHIWGQIVDMTPGQYVHIGGDESHSTPHDQFVDFVQKSVALIRDMGKTPIGWNEYAEAGLGEGEVVQYWTGSTTYTAQAVANGAKVVVSKSDSAYLDMKYSSKTPIGLTWAGQGDLDKYYNWNPVNVIPNSNERSARRRGPAVVRDDPRWRPERVHDLPAGDGPRGDRLDPAGRPQRLPVPGADGADGFTPAGTGP